MAQVSGQFIGKANRVEEIIQRTEKLKKDQEEMIATVTNIEQKCREIEKENLVLETSLQSRSN